MTNLPKRSEHQEQVAVFQWAGWNEQTYPDLKWLHAIPNGGQRHKATAGKMKAEGVKSGVSDIFLPVARGGYFGWYCEMKVKPNKPTENQKEFLAFATAQGYSTCIAYNSTEATDSLTAYLSEPRTAFPAIVDELDQQE